jgi:7,8-dihydroneopterin aldolase/epimerase/oxygenase
MSCFIGFYGVHGTKFAKKLKDFCRQELLDSLALLEDAHLGMKGAPEHLIHIKQLEIFVRVGVPEKERVKPQRLTVSITFWPTRNIRELDDKIGRTVNYSAVCKETKKFAGEQSYNLIETLADRIAAHLLKKFAIQKITIELHKFVLKGAEFVSVTLTRSAPLH